MWKKVLTILGAIAAIIGILAFFGIAQLDDLRAFTRNARLALGDSREVRFMYGDWCSDDGLRQRFEQVNNDRRVTTCLPGAHGDCAAAFARHLESLPAYPVEFSWSREGLTYLVGNTKAPLVVRRISDQTVSVQSELNPGVTRIMRRCGS